MDRAAAFAQCFFFSPKARIDQTQDAKDRTVIGLFLDELFLFGSRCSERSPRFRLIFRHASDEAGSKLGAEINRIVAEIVLTQGNQRALGRGRIALCYRALKPRVGNILDCFRICGQSRFNRLMQPPGISFPVQIH